MTNETFEYAKKTAFNRACSDLNGFNSSSEANEIEINFAPHKLVIERDGDDDAHFRYINFKHTDWNFITSASTVERVDQIIDSIFGGKMSEDIESDRTTDRFKVGVRISDEDRKSFPKCIEFLDYEIVHSGNRDGWVLMKAYGALKKESQLWESHLGNFDRAIDAELYAIYYFMIARPNEFASHVVSRMRKTNSDLYHGGAKFMSVCKKEGITVPASITISEDSNRVLCYNGEPV